MAVNVPELAKKAYFSSVDPWQNGQDHVSHPNHMKKKIEKEIKA